MRSSGGSWRWPRIRSETQSTETRSGLSADGANRFIRHHIGCEPMLRHRRRSVPRWIGQFGVSAQASPRHRAYGSAAVLAPESCPPLRTPSTARGNPAATRALRGSSGRDPAAPTGRIVGSTSAARAGARAGLRWCRARSWGDGSIREGSGGQPSAPLTRRATLHTAVREARAER